MKKKKIITLAIIWMFCLCITGVNAQINTCSTTSYSPENLTTITYKVNDASEMEEQDPIIRVFSFGWLLTILGLK